MGLLTRAEKQQLEFDWRYKGVSVLNLLTEEEVDKYLEELERIRLERQSTDSDNEWGEYDPFMQVHEKSDMFIDLMKHPKVIEAVEFLLESKVFAVQTWAYFKPPGQLGRDMHQNIFYTEVPDNHIVNISLALDNHDPENGSVWYYEGTHRLGRLPIEVDEDRTKTNPKNWRNERGKPCVMPTGHSFPKMGGYLRKGQISFIHSNVVHGSEENKSSRFRRAFLCGYVKDGSHFTSGSHMKRKPIDVGSAKVNESK